MNNLLVTAPNTIKFGFSDNQLSSKVNLEVPEDSGNIGGEIDLFTAKVNEQVNPIYQYGFARDLYVKDKIQDQLEDPRGYRRQQYALLKFLHININDFLKKVSAYLIQSGFPTEEVKEMLKGSAMGLKKLNEDLIETVYPTSDYTKSVEKDWSTTMKTADAVQGVVHI